MSANEIPNRLTGHCGQRFDESFHRIDNRPEGSLRRDTFEEIAAREALMEQDEE